MFTTVKGLPALCLKSGLLALDEQDYEGAHLILRKMVEAPYYAAYKVVEVAEQPYVGIPGLSG